MFYKCLLALRAQTKGAPVTSGCCGRESMARRSVLRQRKRLSAHRCKTHEDRHSHAPSCCHFRLDRNIFAPPRTAGQPVYASSLGAERLNSGTSVSCRLIGMGSVTLSQRRMSERP